MVSCAALLIGCEDPEQITRYRVPREESAPKHKVRPGALQGRMLAAIVPHRETAWFFKLVGPESSVHAASETFQGFIRSVHFSDGKPHWKLPEGWKEVSGDPMRYTTLRLSDENKLEVTVSSLPLREGDEYILANVNRWRNQMALDPVRLSQLKDQVQRIDLKGSTATLVDLKGSFTDTMGWPPFADAAENGPVEPPPIEPIAHLPRFDVPSEWHSAAPVEFSKATFSVVDGDQRVLITLSDLGPGAGDLLANITRWRGQIGLPAAMLAEIRTETQRIQVDHNAADYVHLIGPKEASRREATLGVIVRRPDRIWFIKLRGDATLVDREKPRFETFVQSLKF